MRIKFKAVYGENGLEFLQPVFFKRVAKTHWKSTDKEKLLEVEVGPARKGRSNKQNRYYWGCVIREVQLHIKETQGILVTKDWVHAYHMQTVFEFTPVVKTVLGEEVIYFDEKRLSACSTVEFEERMELLRQYWAERGCDIPEPNEENYPEDIY